MTFDDSELELLLSQAKESLAQKEEQLKQEKLTNDAGNGATKSTKQVSALSVPMRLETVLQLRNVLDPKRFYKKDASAKKIPKYFEVGTIIEGPTEFYSSRLTKKERKTTLVDELLADKQARDYFKRKVNEIHAHNNSGGKNWYKKTTAAAKGGNSKTGHKAKRQRK
ncbi:rrna-processing protein fcf2 [Coemansia sp. RSA 2531]|nr:rrna-processing protein fcf2 [Coemansia sp. RSA 2531]